MNNQIHALGTVPRGKSLRYQLDRRFSGSQSRSGRFGEQNSYPYRDWNSDPSVVQPVTSRCPGSLVDPYLNYYKQVALMASGIE
jgi:hypothetical protein